MMVEQWNAKSLTSLVRLGEGEEGEGKKLFANFRRCIVCLMRLAIHVPVPKRLLTSPTVWSICIDDPSHLLSQCAVVTVASPSSCAECTGGMCVSYNMFSLSLAPSHPDHHLQC